MKHSTFLSLPLLAVVFACLASCGSQENKSGTETSTDSTSSTTTASTPATSNANASTISTTPQDMMVVMHKVADFNKWKMTYDAGDSMRLAHGLHSFVIARGVNDSNMVMVVNKADDIKKAKEFAKSPGLKEAMHKAGVTVPPQICFVTATWQDTGNISAAIRSLTTFKVKDPATWQKTFDSTKQIRTDNGLVDRFVGHDADDNHKISLVLAVSDTAKAQAFWKSDQLKKIRAASSTIGEPERFIYRIAQRY